VVPVDAEPAEVEATLVAGLPAAVGRQRTDQLDAVVGASGKHAVHADIGRVDQMLVGQQAHAGEVGVASWHGIHVGGGGHRGRHVHDQVGRSGSQVLVQWALSPRQPTPRLIPWRASVSEGLSMAKAAGGCSPLPRHRSPCRSRSYCWIQTAQRVCTAGTCRSHGGASAA
jgi:hypothetical protein